MTFDLNSLVILDTESLASVSFICIILYDHVVDAQQQTHDFSFDQLLFHNHR